MAILNSYLEQLFNELNLTPNVVPPQPPNLPFPDHVQYLIALNHSSSRVELSEALLGVDPAFVSAMILLDDVVQVLDRPVSAAGPKRPFLLNS